MNPIVDHLTATNFRDLEGSSIEGRVALSDELINLGIRDFLAGLTQSPTEKATGDAEVAAPAAAPIDPKALFRAATVERLNYRTEQGKTILEVKASL